MNVKKTDWFTDGPVPFRILGEDVQEVEFLMTPGQRVVLQPNTFVVGAGGVRSLGITWGRRLLDPIYRKWSGEASILQEVVCEERPARVVLGGHHIGRVVRMKVTPETGVICQRGAFIASTGEVDLGVAFTRRLRAGIFGGQGIVFQRVTGQGDVFLHARGTVNDWILDEGEIAPVSTNNILAFDASVGYDLQFSGGLMTLMFGGQGFFLSQLQGPGRIITQSIDHDAMADSLAKRPRRMKSKPSTAQKGE